MKMVLSVAPAASTVLTYLVLQCNKMQCKVTATMSRWQRRVRTLHALHTRG